MIYVASPYSSPIDAVREARYRRVRDFIDLMIAKGFVAFSPIVYCHPIAERIGRSTDAQTWMHFNMSILRKCEAMYLLQLEGWDTSKGVNIETNVCAMLCIPIVRYDRDFNLVDKNWGGAVPASF